jgi:MFS superfamily sulfate permease-like transporter
MQRRRPNAVTYASSSAPAAFGSPDTAYTKVAQQDTYVDETHFRKLHQQSVPKVKWTQKAAAWCRTTFTPDFVRALFPPIQWLKDYRHELPGKLRGDVVAGLTVAIIVIPQALSYAALALLNPVVGLYTTIFPTFVYMLLGTSHEMHIGPFALVSLLTADGITAVMPAEDTVANLSAPITVHGLDFADYESASINMATVMSLFVGVFQVLFGVCGVGQIVMAVIADPFVSGFTTGAAFLIAASQLAGLFQVYNFRSSVLFLTIANVTGSLIEGEANWASGLMGFVSFLLLLSVWQINRSFMVGKIPVPGELVVVVLACLVSYYGDLDNKYNMTVVGSIPSGLPTPTLPRLNTAIISALLGPSITISIIGYIISIAVAKLYADRHDYHISGPQVKGWVGRAGPSGWQMCESADDVVVDGVGGWWWWC